MCSIQACEARVINVGDILVTLFLYYANIVALTTKHSLTKIARARSQKPVLLIMDRPSNGLDRVEREVIFHQLVM